MKVRVGLLALFATLLLASVEASRIHQISQAHKCAFENKACRTHDWTKTNRVAGDALHTVTFAAKLAPNAAATCDSLIARVSYPTSSAYQKYYTLEEVDGILSNPANVREIEHFLRQKNLRFQTEGDFITVTAPVSQLEALLNAEFHSFTSAKAKKNIVRTYKYTIPTEIEEHVDFITNTVTFPPVKVAIRTHDSALDKRQVTGQVTPQVLNRVYNIQSNVANHPNATQALFEALGQEFSPADLTSFQRAFNLPVQKVDYIIGKNDGSQCASNPDACGEANLDVQYLMAISQYAKTTYWVIDPSAQDPFYDWVIALAKMKNPPLVHSISYGSIASEDPQNDMLRFNTEICKLGLRGVTVLVASGDDGVANFEARNDASQCGFNPSFPATSPYVLSVGATQGPESGSAEVACSSATGGIITTGGGFSIYFKQPAYQAKNVANYLKNGPKIPPTHLFNYKGRAYPDVALLGVNYQLFDGGNQVGEFGTSASTPVFAGMISLINSARLKAGKPPVGFVNPTLYTLAATKPSIFHDITVGENNCCAGQGSPVCCPYGFTATKGWDPLTGLGSVDFTQLKAAFL